jgi:5'(3')-deoxyribonucleotidase
MKKTPTLLDLYETIKPKYIIFCDMDGVLVDFDKGYKDLTGKYTKHVDVQDKNDFWKLLDKSLKEKGLTEYDYWVNLPWMPDGKELWNYIKPYKPYILTAPTLNPESKEGKREWVQRLDGMKNIYFKPAKFKSDFSGKNRILIDDREDTINRWNEAEGIGILHTSATNTIEQLKQLGL